jgi:hypothetical protein
MTKSSKPATKNAKTNTTSMNTNTDTNFLVPIYVDVDLNIPVFLVDTSGSTDSSLDGSYNYNQKEKYRILDYEIELIGEIAENRGYDEAHVILWSNQAFLFRNVKLDSSNLLDSLMHLTLQANENKSGTHLMSGFNKLESGMYDLEKQTDLIIITDGEIMDSERDIGKELRSICSNEVSLTIVAVERGTKDYLQAGCSVGNKLYSIIQNHNLTRFVNKFSIYNALNTEFINFVNPIVPESYIPYGEMMFARSNFKEFVIFVDSELDAFTRKNGLLESDVMRHAHRLSLTIYHYIKGNNQISQKGLVDLFCKMYEKFDRIDSFRGPNNKTIYEKVRKLLTNEVDNHVAGKSTTFTSARKNRSRKVEDTNLSLMAGVSKAVMGDSIDENSAFYTLPIRSESGMKIYEVSNTDLTAYAIGKTAFKSGCVRIGRYDMPLLFPIGEGCRSAANQWIRTVYSRTLNISPSNPYIYYYMMLDCLAVRQSKNQDLIRLYESYLATFLNEELFDTNRKFIDTIVYNEKVKLKYNVIKGAQLYSGLNLNPLTLFWLSITTYVLPHFGSKTEEDRKKRSRFIKGIYSICAKQVFLNLITEAKREDYRDTPSSALVDEVVWDTARDELIEMIKMNIQIDSIAGSNLLQMLDHTFGDSSIVCPSRAMTLSDDLLEKQRIAGNNAVQIECDVCGSSQELVLTARTDNTVLETEELWLSERTVFSGWTNPVVDSMLRVNLGLLTGENTDTELITPENFEPGAEFIHMDNIMITDPISSSRMRVTTQEEFRSGAYGKYPFLKGLDFTNVALAGGFCRSILLKQEMKDFDFFFYGLKDDSAYEDRFQSFVVDLVNSVRKTNHLRKQNVKFCAMFKPTFNVFELICYLDPTNHIDSNFSLKDFHENGFKSMRRYNGEVDEIGAHDTAFVNEVNDNGDAVERIAKKKKVPKWKNPDEDSDYDSDEESDDYDDYDQPPAKKSDAYFEDGDSKGIRMLHRFQFILCKYDDKFGITQSFDLFPSKTVFDNERVYFTPKSLVAHQYMINEIMLDGGSDLFKHRVSKYFKYGYSIVLPPNHRNWYDDRYQNMYNYVDSCYDGNDENRGPISFEVRRIIDNQIVISHNSNIEKMLERNEELEQKALDNSEALYVSHLFCSFVSILRYVEINGIDHIFPQLPIVEYDENVEVTEDSFKMVKATDLGFVGDGNRSRIKFHDRTLDVKYMDRFNTMYADRTWFDLFYKSMLLTGANDYVLDLSDNFVYKGGILA